MKLKYIAAALVLMSTAAVQGYEPDELRIYINPGHGSWTGNDRPMKVVGHTQDYSSTNTDTLSFFESNTDLIKGFGVLEKLIEMGFPFDRTLNQTGERWEIGAAKDLSQNLVMSRVKNGPYEASNVTSSDNYMLYNRSLLEIAKEVEYNEFDQFISIHSNAVGQTQHSSTNYHLFMYRGKNGRTGAYVEGSYEMCEAASKYSFINEHAQWSASNVYINGDVDFMGDKGTGTANELGYRGYLGVLKHGVPGYLVEGFFHTYSPSRHRAMNWDVDLVEGYQYARGVAEYFELEQRDATGEIYGIVRDAHVKFTEGPDIWVPGKGTDDELSPINECNVYLWQDGEKIKEYTTDNFYNGAFVFIGLEPGKYQVTFEHPQYEECDPVDVEVKAGETTYPKCYLTDIYYNGRPGEDMIYANVIPAGTVTLQSEYTLEQTYTDKEISAIAGMTPKRLIWMKDHAYILALGEDNAAAIVVVNPTTGEIEANVNLEGCENAIRNVSDMQVTADGTLIVSGKVKNQHADKYVDAGEVRGTLYIYRWENDDNGLPTGAPQLWFTTQSSGESYRAYMGDAICYTGTIESGSLAISSASTSSTMQIRDVIFDVTDGEIGEPTVSRPSKLYAKDFGDQFIYQVSPNDRNRFIISGLGTKYGMREYDFKHANNTEAISETPATINKTSIGANFFKFGGYPLMTYSCPETSDNLALYSVDRGISSPEAITLNGIELEGTATNILTTGYPIAITDDAGTITDGGFALMILRDNKLSRFVTENANFETGIQSVTTDDSNAPAIYYDLTGRRVENGNMTQGIYVKVQGSKVSKVMIK